MRSKVIRIGIALALVLALPLAGLAGCQQRLGGSDVNDLRVTQGLTVSGGATIAGGASVAGGLALTDGQLDVGNWASLSAQTAISVTAAATISPTGTYQQLTSASSVTTSTSTAIANGAETGDLLVLINMNASNTITVDGTGGNVECKTDKVLGAKDTLSLIWGGSDWYCLSISDNS